MFRADLRGMVGRGQGQAIENRSFWGAGRLQSLTMATHFGARRAFPLISLMNIS